MTTTTPTPTPVAGPARSTKYTRMCPYARPVAATMNPSAWTNFVVVMCGRRSGICVGTTCTSSSWPFLPSKSCLSANVSPRTPGRLCSTAGTLAGCAKRAGPTRRNSISCSRTAYLPSRAGGGKKCGAKAVFANTRTHIHSFVHGRLLFPEISQPREKNRGSGLRNRYKSVRPHPVFQTCWSRMPRLQEQG